MPSFLEGFAQGLLGSLGNYGVAYAKDKKKKEEEALKKQRDRETQYEDWKRRQDYTYNRQAEEDKLKAEANRIQAENDSKNFLTAVTGKGTKTLPVSAMLPNYQGTKEVNYTPEQRYGIATGIKDATLQGRALTTISQAEADRVKKEEEANRLKSAQKRLSRIIANKANYTQEQWINEISELKRESPEIHQALEDEIKEYEKPIQKEVTNTKEGWTKQVTGYTNWRTGKWRQTDPGTKVAIFEKTAEGKSVLSKGIKSNLDKKIEEVRVAEADAKFGEETGTYYDYKNKRYRKFSEIKSENTHTLEKAKDNAVKRRQQAEAYFYTIGSDKAKKFIDKAKEGGYITPQVYTSQMNKWYKENKLEEADVQLLMKNYELLYGEKIVQ